MLWIWLLTRHTSTWSTGQLDRYFAFVCAHCGISTAAMVRTFGHGSASNHHAAVQKANASADGFAYRAVAAASCPHCLQLQPGTHEGFARAAKKAARRQTIRLPLAAAAAVLMAIVLAIPAVHDLRHSAMLSLVATSVAAAVGALVFAIFSGPVATPGTNPFGVWFSRDPQIPGSWFPAQAGHVPVVAQPAPALRALSLVTMAVTAISAIVALVLWTETFRKVHVVSAEGMGKDLSVSVDGGEAQRVTQSPREDAPTATIEVRTSSTHRIVASAGGKTTTYDLDPSSAKHGWVLAPHGRERGLCLAKIKWYYGTAPKDGTGDDALLGQDSDLVVLPHSFDHVFTSPPATIETQNGSSATRTSLRALDCASLEEDKIVAFKDAPFRPAPAIPAVPAVPDDL
jgi:hypothetical protein